MANRHPDSQAERYVRRMVALTLHDSTNFTDVTDAILVKTAGDYTVQCEKGAAVSVYLAAGIWHPMRVERINSTSAASTSGVVGGYDD